MRPIGIDLFAGAGGMSLGFEQAGFDIVAAVEIDPVHCAVHKFNFPQCEIIPRSVVGLKGVEIRLAAGIGQRTVDVVFGGAPCQGFSLIGQRAIDDPRNALVLEFLRIVSELDAQHFVFENVKGLTLGKHKKFLEEFVLIANQMGYEIRTPWQVLNAANYGTPQNRERLIIFGSKFGLSVPSYPEKRTQIIKRGQSLGAIIPPCPTVLDAIGDLPDADLFEELITSDTVSIERWKAVSSFAKEMRCLTEDAWHFGHKRRWDNRLLSSSARTAHSDISRRRFSETRTGETEPISRFYKLSPDGISNTLRAGTDGARGAFTSPRPIHFAFDRCVTVREMARLQGFPDWFRFNGTKWHGARQVGNSVPPPLARSVAAQVMRAIGLVPKCSQKTVGLGDSKLLNFNVTEAAEYFGVPVPLNKRDRRSGIKKRKQSEVEQERIMLMRVVNG